MSEFERGDQRISLERLAEMCVLLDKPIEEMLAGCVIDEEGHSLPSVLPRGEDEVVAAFWTLIKGQLNNVVHSPSAVTGRSLIPCRK